MIPDELYKRRRRHNNTPESAMLIIVNYVIVAVSVQLFAMCEKINWFFWVVLGTLAIYNFFTIRKNREEYDKIHVYAYVFSLVGLVLLFFLLRLKATPC
ncbi:MAG: hypothetical protein ABIP28_01425 [Mucilaginibacter sp.]